MNAAGMMGRLLDSLKAELRDDDTLCAKVLHPGSDLIADYGECGGMAWVRMSLAYPTENFPQPVAAARNCAYTLAFNVELGIIRAANVGVIEGNTFYPPTDDEQNETSLTQYADMELLLRVWNNAVQEFDQYVLGAYTPMGVEGGIAGGVWVGTIGMDT